MHYGSSAMVTSEWLYYFLIVSAPSSLPVVVRYRHIWITFITSISCNTDTVLLKYCMDLPQSREWTTPRAIPCEELVTTTK